MFLLSFNTNLIYTKMATLNENQQLIISELSKVYGLNCVTFTPSYIAGTFESLDFVSVSEIRETAKESGLTFAICVRDHTFAFISL